MKTVAVIPAYNECGAVGGVVKGAKNYVDEVVVVDDHSKDNTLDEAVKAGAKAVRLIVNMGVGFSTRTGCEIALRNGADIIITLDGDGQHDPSEIPKLVEMLNKEKLDIVFGSRPADKNMPFIKRLGNTGLSMWAKWLFNVDIKDTQTGFHVFHSDAYSKLKWESRRYSMVSEISARTGKTKLKYREVPIKTIYTCKTTGMAKRDAMKALLRMVWWRINK